MAGNIASSSIARPGQIDNTGDVTALDQILFNGMVEHAFKAANKLFGLLRSKPLTPGNAGEEFQLIGKVKSDTHQAGEDILGTKFLQRARTGRRTVYADRPEMSVVFEDSLEKVLSDWDSSNEYAVEIGDALAKKMDHNLFRVLARCARGYVTSVYTGEPNNARVDTTANYDTTGTTTKTQGVLFAGDAGGTATTWTAALWLAAVLRAKRSFDDRNLPKANRYLMIRNEVNEVIFSSILVKDLIDTDYMSGPNANVQEGEIGRLYGFTVIVSNNWPGDDDDAAVQNFTTTVNYVGAVGNDYRCDFRNTISGTGSVNGSNTLSIAFMRPAAGSLTTEGLNIEMRDAWQNRGSAIIGEYVSGHGPLRPNVVIEIVGRQWVSGMLPLPT